MINKKLIYICFIISFAINSKECCPDLTGFSTTGLDSCSNVHTHITYRSQGANTARELIGWQTEIYLPICDYYRVTTFAFEYTKTFKEEQIAQDWFGTSYLSLEGSSVAGRSTDSLIANYFGLNSNFTGAICFCPEIENFIFDWNIFINLDCWRPGLFFRAHLPLVHSKWSLFGEENGCYNGCTYCNSSTLPACFVNPEISKSPVHSIEEALSYRKNKCSDTFANNKSGYFVFNTMEDTKLADIDFILGYNFYNTGCNRFGLYLQYIAPTGTHYVNSNSKNNYKRAYFRPQIGNGFHNELGLGITGNKLILSNHSSQNLLFYVEGNITHMFKSSQCRLFDLCKNGAYSRYMLLREFESDKITPTGNLVMANNTKFANRLLDIEIPVKIDLSFKLAFCSCNWVFDLGYNIYYHSKEKISKFSSSCNTNSYGIAALSGTCCFPITLTTDSNNKCHVSTESSSNSINTTLPNANMFEVTSGLVPTGQLTIPDPGNSNSYCLAFNSDIPANNSNCSSLQDLNLRPIDQTEASVLLTDKDINWDSGLSPAILQSMVFFHINYINSENCYCPFIGIGGEVQFAPNYNIDCNNYDDEDFCGNNTKENKNPKIGLNQWGIWIKAGLSF